MQLQLVRCQNRRFWVLEAHFPAGKARLSLRNAQLHRFGLIKGLRNSSGSHYEEGIYDEGGYVVAGNHFLPHVEIVPIFDIPDYEGDCRSMERRRRRLSTR